jgi:hypothetical protein
MNKSLHVVNFIYLFRHGGLKLFRHGGLKQTLLSQYLISKAISTGCKGMYNLGHMNMYGYKSHVHKVNQIHLLATKPLNACWASRKTDSFSMIILYKLQ